MLRIDFSKSQAVAPYVSISITQTAEARPLVSEGQECLAGADPERDSDPQELPPAVRPESVEPKLESEWKWELAESPEWEVEAEL